MGEALAAFAAPAGVRLEDASCLSAHVVGAELNVAIGLARLGVASAFAGAVGDDVWGRRVRRALAAEGVDACALSTDDQRPTALLFKEGAAGGGLRVHYRRSGSAGAAYRGGETLERLARVARGLHVTGISLVVGAPLRAACLAALRALPAAALFSFDLNVRRTLGPPPVWREALEAVLGRADLVFATGEELAVVGLAADSVAERLGARGGALIVRGEAAESEVHAAGAVERVTAPAPGAPVLDVVGAGDAFAAAAIAMRLRGEPWRRAALAGHLAGGAVVSRLGDYEGAPYASELEALLQGGAVSR